MTHQEIQEKILEREQERAQALIAADYLKLETLLTDDLVHVHANGIVEHKEDFLASIKKKYTFLKIDRGSLQMRFVGNVVIVNGPLNQNVRRKETGELVEMRAVATQIWVEQAGEWRQCSFQATRIS